MHNPCHPGEVLKEALSEISVTDAARRLGVGRVALSRLLNRATGISPEMALRLSKALGTGAQVPIFVEANYFYHVRNGKIAEFWLLADHDFDYKADD
jgi:addiction module HigA family antidote